MPTSSRSSSTRTEASSIETCSWSAIASAICQLIRRTGFREFMAPWKMMEMCFHRIRRSSDSLIKARSFPSYFTLPPMIRPFLGSRRMMERAVVVFPHPLSPARPTDSPFSSLKETLSTARTTPERVSKQVSRFAISNRLAGSPLPQAWVQNLVEGVPQEGEAQNHEHEGEARHHDPGPPPVQGRAGLLRLKEDHAPAEGSRVHPAQEGEAALGQDRDGDREDRVREDEGEDVPENVFPEDRDVARSRGLRALDEGPLLHAQDLGPNDPRREVPAREPDRDDDDP